MSTKAGQGQLTLPDDAALKSSPDGGALIASNGRKTVVIPPPSATDASGDPVPAELQVNGDELTVAISPDEGAAYPILVDPEYIVEGWHWTLQHDSLAAWSGSTNTPSYQPIDHQYWNPTWYPGLDLTSGFPGPAYWGTHADWSYWVPRYQEDLAKFGVPPTTWILQMYTEGVLFHPNGNGANYPALVMGLVDSNFGWEVTGVHYGGQGEMDSWNNAFWFNNDYSQTGTKGADMNLVTYEYEPQAKWRDTYVAYAAIATVDGDAPKILELNPPGKWTTGASAAIPYLFEDAGLGMRSAWIRLAGETAWRPGWGADFWCQGTTAYPCPRLVKSGEYGRPNLTYAPDALPTGRNKLEVMITDPIGSAAHVATGYVVVKVDNTAPEIALSGSLTEQGSLGTNRPAYALRVRAKDGVEGAPQSGVAKVEVKVDGEKIAMPDEAEWAPNCQTENCPFKGEWGLDASEFTPGTHEVQVVATDAVGKVATKSLLIELHPPAPSLDVSGTLTEQATLGVSRPQYSLKIDASSMAESPVPPGPPSFSSAFGTAGSGNGQFDHPGDIAIDSKGYLWVLDTKNNRIQTFAANGSYVATVGSTGAAPGQFNRPTALAIDANDNAWVVDAGNRRVQEFSWSGAFIRQFGTAGTGEGQFAGSGPEGIAIDYHGNIWVADTYGARLEKFNDQGQFLNAFGIRGLGPGQFVEPAGLEVGPGGSLWVTDWGRNKVLEFTSTGEFVREFGSEGSGNGEFRHPSGIAIDSKGDVWVGDQNNERVQEFNQAGEFVGSFGSPGSGAGQFNLGYPIGIASDASGNLWVTDTGNNRIQKWTIPGYTTPSGPSFLRTFGSPGTASGQFSDPTGVAFDGKGNVWVAEFAGNRIQKFNENGEYLLKVGTSGSGNGQFNHPRMLATDQNGRVWVSDSGNNRIQEFSESGAFIRAFGTLGGGVGQLNNPTGIAVDSNGRVWVADTNNNRLVEFDETGTFIRAVGSKGAGPGLLNEPLGIVATPEGNIWVVDFGNSRLVEFNESGSFIRQVGSLGAGIGQYNWPMDIAVDSNGRLWVAEWSTGRIQELTPSGEFIAQFGSFGTGQGSFRWPYAIDIDAKGRLALADWGNSRVDEWSLQPMHSQISIEIAVDGKRVDATESACAAEACPAQHEWTLDSSAMLAGIHYVTVRATDGLGNTTTKTLSFETERDVIKPDLNVGGQLANAPEGWVEQEEHGIHASATDSGYGVTSLALKIDGSVVVSTAQNCAQGACAASIADEVDMGDYEGGAHQAEIVATDGAGNVSTRGWTINVDPEGHISPAEAEATLEALDETADVNTVGPAAEEEIEGTAPGIGVALLEEPPNPESGEIGTGFEAIESSVPLVIGAQPEEGMEYHVLPEVALLVPCEESSESKPPTEGESGEAEEPETVEPDCVPRTVIEERAKAQEEEVASGSKYPGLMPITVTPVATSETASPVTNNGSAALAANTAGSVDTVTRPLSDGGLTFQMIRDTSAPLHYAFEMDLSAELELRQVNEGQVAVYYKEGFPAFTISATPAHDAIGSTVATQLVVTGPKTITLTVNHRALSPAGGSFVYPVIGGAGWEGGFRTIQVDLDEPEPEQSPEEEGFEVLASESGSFLGESGTWYEGRHALIDIGAPEARPNGMTWRPYRFNECRFHLFQSQKASGPGTKIPGIRRKPELERRCHNPLDPEPGDLVIRWADVVAGGFRYIWGYKVEMTDDPTCRSWGELPPIKRGCFADRSVAYYGNKINVIGRFRHRTGAYGFGIQGGQDGCQELNGVLPTKPLPSENGERAYHENYHEYREGVNPEGGSEPAEACPWGSLEVKVR